MRNLKVILSIIIIILVSFHAKSAESRWDITGQIVDGQTQETLPYVTITLNVQSDSSLVTGTISDANGEFILEKVAKGNYYIKLSFIGFADQFVNDISFKKDLKTVSLGKIVLDHSSSLLGEVDITSRVSPVSNKIDKQVINVDKNISAKGGTAVDALRLSPSVQVDGDGNVKLRGSTKFLVLINGKPTSLTPDEVLRQTPANMISNIEVITNPSVKYSAEGGAGIININLKKGIVRGINGMINASVGTKNKYSGDFSLNMNRKKEN